jgi:hypothetical protein
MILKGRQRRGQAREKLITWWMINKRSWRKHKKIRQRLMIKWTNPS